MAIRINRNEIPETVIEAKRWWRKEIRRVLRETTSEYRESASAAISANVLEMEEYRNAKVILAYVSVGREVSTDRLIRAMIEDGKRVLLPRCVDIGEDGKRTGGAPEMEAREVTDPDNLAEGAYGIPEPGEGDRLVPPGEIDLIVLPCMACDVSCRRIGHGAGYYDKFLSEIRDDCFRMAVCFDAVLADELPVEEHDMPVDAVVTEDAVYRWRPEDHERA